MIQDLRNAVRAVASMRGVAVVAILTMALGIGAATTGFSVVYAALLRPLPFEASSRLVMLYLKDASARSGEDRVRWSFSEITALGSSLRTLEDLAWYTQTNVNLTSDGDPEQITGEAVSPAYFRVLRIAPQAGRGFLPEEGTLAGVQPVTVISARLWHRRFGSDSSILGRSIAINQVPLTVVGILPDTFFGLSGRAQFWIPTPMASRISYAEYLTTPQHFINLIGRLAPGVSLGEANAEGSTVAIAERRTSGAKVVWSATMWPLARARVDESVRASALLLLAAVACVLLIACVNIATVLLARARGRRREMAVRLAIGASRARIVRQLLAESLVLAALGGTGGALLAVAAVRSVAMPSVIASARNSYAQVAAFATPAVDWIVLAFVIAVTVSASVLFGLAPALEGARTDLVTALKEGGRTGASGARRRTLARLVTTEVALAVLLLTGAGLLIRSVARLQVLREGFEPAGVLTFRVNPPASRYPPDTGPAIVERLLTAIQHVPGITTAAVNRCVPLTGCARTTLFFPGRPPDASTAPVVGRHYVSADYFRTLGIPLRAGRTLADSDRLGRPPVTVVNEAAARRFWPGQNPIGQHVWFGSATGFTSPDHPVEVVGVVGDVRYGGVDESVLPDFYTSYLQFAFPDTTMIVKSDLPPATIVRSLGVAVASVDSGLPIFEVRTLDESVAESLSRPQFNAAVAAAFAIGAIVLAGIGVYGVMAYSVSSRLREIGVRLALGADRRRVVALVVRECLWLTAAGAVLGLVAALLAGRGLTALLFGVAPADPWVMTAAAGIMMVVALVAVVVPALRAGSVDPVIVLRNE